jgi:hypothetical protein
MIRLYLTLVACLALQPAAPAAHAPDQASIGVPSGGERVAMPSLPAPDAAAGVALLPVLPSLSAPAWVVVDAARLASHRAVARLWLRGARLLC